MLDYFTGDTIIICPNCGEDRPEAIEDYGYNEDDKNQFGLSAPLAIREYRCDSCGEYFYD